MIYRRCSKCERTMPLYGNFTEVEKTVFMQGIWGKQIQRGVWKSTCNAGKAPPRVNTIALEQTFLPPLKMSPSEVQFLKDFNSGFLSFCWKSL